MSPSPIHRQHFTTTDSTNLEARRYVENGGRGPKWFTADRQISGRGRKGRKWISETGNLYATLLLDLPVSPAIAAQAGFVAAIAIADAAANHTDKPVSLKWPNDVLLSGKKMAGILSETVGTTQANRTSLAIGCGINLAHAPKDTPYGATFIGNVTTEDFFNDLAASFNHWLQQWKHGANFDVIRTAWKKRAAWLGQTVTIETVSGDVSGCFTGLGNDGSLCLKLSDDTQKQFHSGDVRLKVANGQ